MRRPKHNLLLLTSQALLLVLIAALAWQGISAARTQERMVRGLLGDYALLIAENAERGLNNSIGYRTFYALLQALQSQADRFPMDTPWHRDVFTHSPPLPVNAGQVLAVAVRDKTGHEPRVLWRGTPGGQETDWQALLARIEKTNQPTGFRVHHPLWEGRTQTVLSAPLAVHGGEVLVWFHPDVIASRIRSLLETATLLPAALGDPDRIRPHIRFSLKDPAGRPVFATSQEPQGASSRSRVVNGDYSGLMAGFEIAASIDPGIADELVIGGLPYDWLPLFIGLVAITLLLGVLTFFLARRQREVLAMRDDFIARVSHELRTPLTQIRMYAESLMHGRISEIAARNDALGVINRETIRLGHMVDSILQFEKPASDPPLPERAPYRLADWGQSLQSRFRPLLDASGARLELSIPKGAMARCNRDALIQIAGNLVDNSLKYGPAGQAIQVRYTASETGWRLEFRDQGPGIPAGWREAVFEPYRRLSRDRQNGSTGTGIGLSVARDIARSLGGDLHYDPGEGNGCFVLTIRESRESPRGMPDG